MSFADSPHLWADTHDISVDNPLWEKRFDHVMCFGTFDIFHPGHEYYLSSARKFAREMTVVIARDARVLQVKWRPPQDDELLRLKNVQESFPHAHVILGDESDIFAPLRTYSPDILAFWYDQRVPEEKIRELFPYIEIIRVGWYETEKWKSSLLRADKD